MNRESEVVELWPKQGAGKGVHLLGEWYGCGARRALLAEADHLQRLCRFAVEGAGLSVVADHFHQCSRTGLTGTVLLDESHLVIHTWPANRSVALDVFISTRARDSRVKARAIYTFLRDGLMPAKENFLQISRGGMVEVALESL